MRKRKRKVFGLALFTVACFTGIRISGASPEGEREIALLAMRSAEPAFDELAGRLTLGMREAARKEFPLVGVSETAYLDESGYFSDMLDPLRAKVYGRSKTSVFVSQIARSGRNMQIRAGLFDAKNLCMHQVEMMITDMDRVRHVIDRLVEGLRENYSHLGEEACSWKVRRVDYQTIGNALQEKGPGKYIAQY